MSIMPQQGLEAFYDAMAVTLDDLPEDKQALFLSKVALYLASRLSDPDEALNAIAAGRANLE